MARLVDYLHNPISQELAYSVLLGLMLSELHLGTCVAPPETETSFGDEVCDIFMSLLQHRKSLNAGLFVSG